MILVITHACLFADLIITRQEGDFVSQEIYSQGKFAEVIDNRVVSVWDFRNMTLMMIGYEINAYTIIDFNSFKKEITKQTNAEIAKEVDSLDDETKNMMIESTKALYSRLAPRVRVVEDTVMIANYPSFEYKVLNDTLTIQRLWISPKLKEEIGKEIPIASMQKVEALFKERRAKLLAALGLTIDSITEAVEAIEQNGYIMKRFDYGMRTKSNPAIYAAVESVDNSISEVSHMKVDNAVFLPPKGFKKLSYSNYQIQMIKYMEGLE